LGLAIGKKNRFYCGLPKLMETKVTAMKLHAGKGRQGFWNGMEFHGKLYYRDMGYGIWDMRIEN